MYILCIAYCSTTINSLPLEDAASRNTRQIPDFGFPTGTDKIDEPTFNNNNSCFDDYNITMNETIFTEEGLEEMREVTIQTRACCAGHTGTECDILLDPFIASDPCNNRTCLNNPEAQCAVINQCGSQVAVFLNDFGQIVDCNDEDSEDDPSEEQYTTNEVETTNTADTDISTLSCQGYCDHDPCLGQTCPLYAGDAFCFQSGCDCQPLWITSDGVQVNCTSGAEIDPLIAARVRRQALYPSISLSSCS